MVPKKVGERGEQRFAAITYRMLSRWTGLRLSTVQSYGAHGFIPKDDMEAVLQWVARHCRERGRPGPWQVRLSQRDRMARDLGFWCYQDYLKSDLWQEIRSRLLPADCCHCGEPAKCVHHHRYSRENMSGKTTANLVPLCISCHLKEHQGIGSASDQGYYEYEVHTGYENQDGPPPVKVRLVCGDGILEIPTEISESQAPEAPTGGQATKNPRENKPETPETDSQKLSVHQPYLAPPQPYNPLTGDYSP